MSRTQLSKRSAIQLNGVNPYVRITNAEAATLKPNWRGPLPVFVQVNNQPKTPWQINMVPMGTGDFYLYLHGDVRKASGTKVGDTVDVTVWLDETYQAGPDHFMPNWFREALDKNASATEAWNALSPSKQKEVARYLGRLKSDQAKARNLSLTMRALSGETIHFLGRDWVNGK